MAGDLAALMIFAAAGRANHGEGGGLEILSTALPFVVGWFGAAALLDGFGPDARKKGVPAAAATAAKCWVSRAGRTARSGGARTRLSERQPPRLQAVGIPVGLVLRGLLRGYVPPTPFIAVALGVNAVLLIGWRSALAAATKPVSLGAHAQKLRWLTHGELAWQAGRWGQAFRRAFYPYMVPSIECMLHCATARYHALRTRLTRRRRARTRRATRSSSLSC